jgi:hypothetical protein
MNRLSLALFSIGIIFSFAFAQQPPWIIIPDNATLQSELIKAKTNGAEVTFLINGPVDLSQTPGLTMIPNNVSLKIQQGGKFLLGDNNLEINGALESALRQIFIYNGNGIISGDMQVEHVVPQWWGAVANGPDSDAPLTTSAIQYAINYCVSTDSVDVNRLDRKKTLFIPAGEYKINSTLIINARYFDIRGEGFSTDQLYNDPNLNPIYQHNAKGGTIIHSLITNGHNVIEILSSNPAYPHIEGGILQSIKIEGNGSYTEGHGIYCHSSYQKNTIWRDIYVLQVGGDGFHFEGFSFLMNFEFCQARSCGSYGFNFIGGTPRNTYHCLGQSVLLSCASEECKTGELRIVSCADAKIIGGQFQGNSQTNVSENATVHISNAMGIDFFSTCIEGGQIGMKLDSNNFMTRIFGGRFCSQTQRCLDYEGLPNNQNDEAHNSGLSILGTCFGGAPTHIYLNNNCYYASIDAWAEGNSATSRSGLIIEDHGVGNKCAYGLANIVSNSLNISGTNSDHPGQTVFDIDAYTGHIPQQSLYCWNGSNNNYFGSRLTQVSDVLRLQYSPSATTIGTHSFTDGITIKNNGNVGIGTTSTGPKLDVNGDTRITGQLELNSPSGPILTYKTNGYVIGRIQCNSSNDLYIESTFGGNTIFKNSTNGSLSTTERMRIDPNGNVGIGNPNPGAKLDVNGGDISVSSNGKGIILKSTNGIIKTLYLKDDGTLGLK